MKKEICNNLEKPINIEWNVLAYDTICERVKIFNVFEYKNFCQDAFKILICDYNYTDFKQKLEKLVLRYFTNNDCIITICSYPTFIDEKEINRIKNKEAKRKNRVHLDYYYTIDIFNQLFINWELFCQYVYGFRERVSSHVH